MRIRWYGQSAFLISAERTVFVDPFGVIEGVEADLLLVTHEHGDHNAVEVVGGSPQILRSTAGTFDSPIGEVIAVAFEHDDAAGTKHGLDPPDAFLDALGARVERIAENELEAEQPLGTADEPTLALLAAPASS